jgi:hypothetical protein
VAHQVDVAVTAAELEIAVVGAEPLIEDNSNLDATVTESEGTRGLFAAMPRVTLHLDGEERCIRQRPSVCHSLIIGSLGRGRGALPGRDVVLECCVLSRSTRPLRADVAQLVEQLIRNQQVTRSSRVVGSTFPNEFNAF